MCSSKCLEGNHENILEIDTYSPILQRFQCTPRTIATSLIHFKLNYCNSLFLNLPQSQPS